MLKILVLRVMGVKRQRLHSLKSRYHHNQESSVSSKAAATLFNLPNGIGSLQW